MSNRPKAQLSRPDLEILMMTMEVEVAILLYLADKTGQLIPTAPTQRYETLAWVFFQMSAIGPTFGHLGLFLRFGGKDYEDKRPRQRFIDESKRLLGILVAEPGRCALRPVTDWPAEL